MAATVDAWVLKSKRRARAVFHESVDRLGERLQVPVGHGGNMPVDTGFLRASYQVQLGGLPSGPGQNPGGTFGYDGSQVALTIARAELGAVLYGGWTAEYAPFMEEKYGFLRLGVLGWQGIVDQVVAEAKARYP